MKFRESATKLIRSFGVFLGWNPSSIYICALPVLLLFVACGAPEMRRTASTFEFGCYTGHGDIDSASRSRVGDVPFGSRTEGDVSSYGFTFSIQPLAALEMENERQRDDRMLAHWPAIHDVLPLPEIDPYEPLRPHARTADEALADLGTRIDALGARITEMAARDERQRRKFLFDLPSAGLALLLVGALYHYARGLPGTARNRTRKATVSRGSA